MIANSSAELPLLLAEEVSLLVGRQTLLNKVNVYLRPGEVLSIIGPNGAGKTSLLRCLTDDCKPSSGDILFQGRALSEWSIRERAECLSMLPQRTILNFPFSVEDVIALGRTPHTESTESAQAIVDKMLERFDLLSLKDHAYTRLSGGEQQRVQLARVFAQVWSSDSCADTPRLLVLDEPTTALDFRHQKALMTVLAELRDNNVAIIFATHELNFALKVSNRVLGLKAGRECLTGVTAEQFQADKLSELFDTKINVATNLDDGSNVITGL